MVMPIHRRRGSSETVVILRGKIQWVFYDDNGVETERVTLDAGGDLLASVWRGIGGIRWCV